ncbi:sterol desaturase family protein [Biformimicrobium ophioploci]|uniref:Sterol desaturase family protein n=1 Tax=Biformimicrobium ophioploci TaxID=3036711 RepID=A0ABQ6LVQ7_9GAMM|nr:sterol desaturase family protein [Microbulbifer sp. NKW57]GMG86112.1 sterol desaturase family protein [Microbulbifer sp. NKW57]
MSLITLAIPAFFALILIELAYDRWKGLGLYRLNDALGSLAAGVMSRLSGLVKFGFKLLIYIPIFQLFAPLHEALGLNWSIDNPWHVLLAVAIYDFCYYWAHRFGHEMNILWASHLVHHQSEEYNLTTALRQTGTPALFGPLFYIPAAILGVDPAMLALAGAIDLIYQFWVHTRAVPKVRWAEWIFVTPSNHRVHHAQNKVYVDRNYGGVLIIWDRLFGTYQEELDEEPCIFGVRKALNSFDPVAANLQHYRRMWLDACYTRSWWDKLTLWFRRTGYRPADAEAAMPVASTDLYPEGGYRRFDPEIGTARRWYAFTQHALYTLVTLALIWQAADMSYAQVFGSAALLALGLMCNGRILDAATDAGRWEVARLLLLAGIALALIGQSTVVPGLLGVYAAVSLLLWRMATWGQAPVAGATQGK